MGHKTTSDVSTYVRTYLCKYVRTYLCRYVQMLGTYPCKYVHKEHKLGVHMYVRIYVYMNIFTYVPTHIRTVMYSSL